MNSVKDGSMIDANSVHLEPTSCPMENAPLPTLSVSSSTFSTVTAHSAMTHSKSGKVTVSKALKPFQMSIAHSSSKEFVYIVQKGLFSKIMDFVNYWTPTAKDMTNYQEYAANAIEDLF